MSFPRHILPVLILAACGGIAALLYVTREEPTRRSPPPTPVSVDAVRLVKQTYPVVIQTRGTVRPRTESTLIPEVSGTIVKVSPSFREGEFFEQGDALLTIDPLNYKTAVTVAQSVLAQAKVMLEEEKARAEQALVNWKQLGGKGEPGALVLRLPQVTEAEARVAAAQAELDKAARDLERTTIRAPYAGRVLAQDVDVGQYVGPGTVLARIYAVDYVEIRLPLTNDQLAFVDLPEKYRDDENRETLHYPEVTLRGNIGGRTHAWKGKIVRVEGAIDERNRQLFVVAQVDDPYSHKNDSAPPLKIGLFVEAAVAGNVLKDVFVLPRSAVRPGDEVVLVDAESKLQRHSINPVWRDDSSVIIDSNGDGGLHEGQIVCITPLSYVANGVPASAVIDGVAPAPRPLTGAGRKRLGPGGPPAAASDKKPPLEKPSDPAT